MKILFISRWFPYPPNNGSKIRIYNLIRGIAKYHEITLISFVDPSDITLGMDQLRAYCQHIEPVPLKPYEPNSLRARLGFLYRTPRSLRDTFSPEMARCIEETISHGNYDLVIASQMETASYFPYFRGTPAIFEEIELGVPFERFKSAKSILPKLRYGLTWVKHRSYINSLLKFYRACTVASNREKFLVAKFLNDHESVKVIPNCVDINDYQDVKVLPEHNRLIFTGSFKYRPNYESMIWFLENVFPLVQGQIPGAQLTITGDHLGLPLPDAKSVSLTGQVEDVRPLIAGSWISLAPIFEAGGTRLKILEAMALRTPVIATTKGAEGLEVQNGVHLLIADTPIDFSKAVIRLLNEPDLRNELSENAYNLVSDKYNWTRIMPVFLNLIQAVVRN